MPEARFSLYLTREGVAHFERYAQRQRLTNRAMVEAAILCVSAFCQPAARALLLEMLDDVPAHELDELITLAWNEARAFNDRQPDADRVRLDIRLDADRYERFGDCARRARLSKNAALASVFNPWGETKEQRHLRWRIFNWAAERAGEEEYRRRKGLVPVS